MAATVELSETNGSGAGTRTNGIASLGFGGADTYNLNPAANPTVLPGSGIGYSYTKWIQFHVTNWDTSVQIGTIKVWKVSGSFMAGEGIGIASLLANPNFWSAAYATSNSSGGLLGVTVPYSGNGSEFLGGNKWDTGGIGIPTSLPASASIGVNGTASATNLTPGGNQYSDFACMCRWGTKGTTPTDVLASTNTGAIVVIAFTYSES